MNYFSKQVAAKKLGVSNRTVDNWMADGKISFTKVGRKVIFSDHDLESLIKNFHQNAFYYQKQYEQKFSNFLEQRKSTNF
jgi:excisionase family DNA binding protein